MDATQIFNKLIDPKYTLKLLTDEPKKSFHIYRQNKYLGVISYITDRIAIYPWDANIEEIITIPYNDPDYPIKLNNTLETLEYNDVYNS